MIHNSLISLFINSVPFGNKLFAFKKTVNKSGCRVRTNLLLYLTESENVLSAIT